MSATEVIAFTTDHIEGAAKLLAGRHTAHREASPLLSPRYEDPEIAWNELLAAFDAESSSGAVALTENDVTGYILGAPKSTSTWGPNIWVEAAGLAVTDAELMREVYAVAAQRWFDEGMTSHFLLVPSWDLSLLDAGYRLGFGQQHAHAIQPARAANVLAPQVVVRRADRDDIDQLAALDLVLPEHQGRSPVFSGSDLPTLEEAKAEWQESIADHDFANFLAEVDGAVVGAAIGCSLEKSNSTLSLARPEQAGFLGFAAVLADARGRGVGRALGETVIGWSHEEGFTSVVTDWRVTNLLSSRAWPKLGFETTFLRLARTIGRAG